MTAVDGKIGSAGVRAAGESQLRRGLRALEALADRPRTASEVARLLGVNRSTALRLLAELEDCGYVKRDPLNKRYSPRAERFYALIVSQHEHVDWSELIQPALALLQEESGEATVFGVPANGTMVYMAYFPSPHPVAVRERVGTVRPMHASALGQAYLSALDPAALQLELRRIVYEGGTERAVKEPSQLRARVEQVRKRGYAIDQDETFDGVSCVAAPVRIGGALIGAAGISGPSSRLTSETLDQLGPQLIGALAAVERSA